jgi:RNA polymerase sigma factor (sigma-70 family)
MEENNAEFKLKELYLSAFPPIARFIAARGGSPEQAKDIFQESVIIYYEQVISGTKQITTSPQAYIFGVAKHKWSALMRHHSIKTIDLEVERLDILVEAEPEVITDKLMQFMKVSGRRCMNLLRSFYYQNISLEEIAKTFGYSDTRSATVQKYKCLEKVRTAVKEKSLQYEDFLG